MCDQVPQFHWFGDKLWWKILLRVRMSQSMELHPHDVGVQSHDVGTDVESELRFMISDCPSFRSLLWGEQYGGFSLRVMRKWFKLFVRIVNRLQKRKRSMKFFYLKKSHQLTSFTESYWVGHNEVRFLKFFFIRKVWWRSEEDLFGVMSKITPRSTVNCWVSTSGNVF